MCFKNTGKAWIPLVDAIRRAKRTRTAPARFTDSASKAELAACCSISEDIVGTCPEKQHEHADPQSDHESISDGTDVDFCGVSEVAHVQPASSVGLALPCMIDVSQIAMLPHVLVHDRTTLDLVALLLERKCTESLLGHFIAIVNRVSLLFGLCIGMVL